MFDIDDVKRQHADACAVEASKDKIITVRELFDYVEALNLELQEVKEEVNDQKRLVASFKEENKKNESKLNELQHNESKLSYVSVLVDGDGMNFHEKLIQDGKNGGYEAASLLIEAVEDHVRTVVTKVPPNIQYKVRVYVNVEGLTQAYRGANILRGEDNLTTFIQGFNKADTLCDIVDAGNGKECADVKLKAHFEQDMMDVHCLRVVFCASADGGYARVLGPCRRSKCISLVKGPPFAREMEELAADLETTSFERVFTSYKLKSTRRVSIGNPSTSITPPRPPTANYASAAKKSPPLQSSSLVVDSTTPNAGIPKLVCKNASGQRVDPRAAHSPKDIVEILKRRKLCNQFHILGSCIYGGQCMHEHDPALSSQDILDLIYIARLSVCPNGSYCDDVRCVSGHRCPHMYCSGG
ncbi:uncharacterized protein TRUGW13939_07575 [Talaromyces rugulosus]|uniref:C3H1-type domain-containing protein n=1 Tax=Talaromyces rugulosus TaxID=121627 RepID=A0A7H8R224_TALRU|nr:uncharacterized protein TRUGW13939_07575 [Talaromyces rugulosus]QKX60430.1 hypothetical protein TRUGW13939_07575 [Talaromyces rugulosus]